MSFSPGWARYASRPLRVVVASGKGGTGKTTLAVSLAVVLAEELEQVAYVDCDVEEPNGHLFLRPTIHSKSAVVRLVPEVDTAQCTMCGACGRACRFAALAVLPSGVVTFPKLCHGCGGCSHACPQHAIREVPHAIGDVEVGLAGAIQFLRGQLTIGEAMAPPVVRAVLQAAPPACTLVLDAPPGTSCPVVESVKAADVALLVTEPTPFGLSDLKQAVAMVRELGIPLGVIVNRAGTDDSSTVAYCESSQIPILAKIPNDLAIARAYSHGALAVTAFPPLRALLRDVSLSLHDLVNSSGAKRKSVPSSVTVAATRHDYAEQSPVQLGRRRDMPEVVVISGKGGTGKTSIVASFCALADRAGVADCDVDAADLHLVLDPHVVRAWLFSGRKAAIIDANRCASNGVCSELCSFDAIRVRNEAGTTVREVDSSSCEGCGVCVDHCANAAISLTAPASGVWFVSDTKYGPFVHARLGVAQENSGKFVSLVRREARALCIAEGRDLLICDGSPGIGCPVIASIAGARLVLAVAEPTLAGLHDVQRVFELCRQMNLNVAVCINKADINSALCGQIEELAAAMRIPVLGRIRYDESVTRAQVEARPVVELEDSPAAEDIRNLWSRVRELMLLEPRGSHQPSEGRAMRYSQ